MQYVVIHPGGQRYGPVDLPELQRWVDDGRVLPATLVEEAGSGRTMAAQEVAGLRFPLAEAPPPMGQSAYTRSGYVDPVPNHLAKAVLSTLCCCMPFGIVAIVYSAQVQGFAQSGNTDAAWKASRSADMWANVSIGLGILGTCGWFALGGLGGLAGM